MPYPTPFRGVGRSHPRRTSGAGADTGGADAKPKGVRVPHLDPGIISPTCRIVIIGKTHTGKTELVKDLAYHQRRAHEYALGFIGTADTRKDYARTFGTSVMLHNDYSADVLRNLFDTNEILLALDHRLYSGLVVIDDCSKKKNLFQDDGLVELAKNARHYNVGVIIATQYCMDLSPAWRNQVDILILLRNGIPKERKKIHECFFGGDYRQFEKLMDACTKNYMALVLDNRTAETDIMKRVYWYKAQLNLPRFDLRSRDFERLEAMYALAPEIAARNRIEALMARRGIGAKHARTAQRRGAKASAKEEEDVVVRLPPKPARPRPRQRAGVRAQ